MLCQKIRYGTIKALNLVNESLLEAVEIVRFEILGTAIS